jgi:hypothetical protein
MKVKLKIFLARVSTVFFTWKFIKNSNKIAKKVINKDLSFMEMRLIVTFKFLFLRLEFYPL